MIAQSANPNARRQSRPLVCVNAVMGRLDLNEDAVLRLVEEGKLIAFDIRRKGARARALRVLDASVGDHLHGRPIPFPETPQDLQQIVSLVLPGQGETVTAANVAGRLNCSSEHVRRLIADRLLIRVGPKARRGLNGSPAITRQSLVAFLKRRLVK